ncbi:hypothetical protein [Halomarina oriensis]|uniref:Uncharacterized protein n=1 Tax=Halomarina oriensis TaxID=671145 RepID=A0A6B0GKH2_9EURY|nr:hypothetical protein [Halomarina oriensis]MWG33919.1 hypothetical protein [Halomarina oriensis]
MESRMRAVLLYVGLLPTLVVLAGLVVSSRTALRFEALVLSLTVVSILAWLVLLLTDDGPVATDSSDTLGLARPDLWDRDDPAAERDSFSVSYRLYVSLVCAAVGGWALLLVG